MKKEINEQICTITPQEKQIDVNNVETFSKELMETLKDPFRYILDLQNVSFIDSSGLGSLIAALRFVSDSGRDIVLCSANPAVEVLFKMVRLSQIASIYSNRQEAEHQLTAGE